MTASRQREKESKFDKVLTHTAGPGIRRKHKATEGINHADFSEHLGKANQLLERHYKKEGDKNTLYKSRRTELSGSGSQGNLPVKSTSLRSRYQQGCAKQARRSRLSGLTEVLKPPRDANYQMRPSRSNDMGWRKTPPPKKNRVMDRTSVKNPRSPVNATN